MLPYPRRSFLGYRLLQEFFTFPEKFFFVDITGLERGLGRGFKNNVEFDFPVLAARATKTGASGWRSASAPKMFRLGCVPIINLFPQTAEPILLDQLKYEYPVVPDVRRPTATEIFSVDSVRSIDPSTRQIVTLPSRSIRSGTNGRSQAASASGLRTGGVPPR